MCEDVYSDGFGMVPSKQSRLVNTDFFLVGGGGGGGGETHSQGEY